MLIPPVAGASLPCRDWIPREERRKECKAIARAFLQGDTAVAEAAGQTMTEALWAARLGRGARCEGGPPGAALSGV